MFFFYRPQQLPPMPKEATEMLALRNIPKDFNNIQALYFSQYFYNKITVEIVKFICFCTLLYESLQNICKINYNTRDKYFRHFGRVLTASCDTKKGTNTNKTTTFTKHQFLCVIHVITCKNVTFLLFFINFDIFVNLQ